MVSGGVHLPGDSVPIWQVIEEFKDKIKTQEAELKKRREELDTVEVSLRERSEFLDQRESKLSQKEQELDIRQRDLEPREVTVERKEKELSELETALRTLENDLNGARVTIENRDRDLAAREQEALKFAERSALYESETKEATQNLAGLEEKILAEQKELTRIITEVTTRREEMLAKMKVLSEQEVLLGESKRLVMDEQRRFVDWERGLNDREAAMGERERAFARREASPLVGSVARPAAEPKPRQVREEKRLEPKPTMEEPRHHAHKPEPVHEPVKEDRSAVKVEQPEPVVESEESGFSEAFCPECRTIVSASADSCYACGADLKNPRPVEPKKPVEERTAEKPKEDEKPKEEPPAPVAEHKEEEHSEVKRSVSIRKIIKRK